MTKKFRKSLAETFFSRENRRQRLRKRYSGLKEYVYFYAAISICLIYIAGCLTMSGNVFSGIACMIAGGIFLGVYGIIESEIGYVRGYCGW